MSRQTLILILSLALFLRISRIEELAKFNYDEARDAIIERQILKGDLTLLGPETKIGDKIIYFGPLHYYLMAPALLIAGFNPVGTYIWTAILGVLTTYLIFKLTKNFLSTAFYAVFPLAVIFNRWAWNPNTIPLFSTLFLISLFKKQYFLAGVFLGLTFQLHFTTLALIFPLAVFLYHQKKLTKPSDWFKIFIGFVLGISPIILFELRHNFLYLQSVLSLINVDQTYRSLNWHYFLWVLPILALLVVKLPKTFSRLIVSASFSVTLIYILTQHPNVAMNPSTIERLAKIIAADQKRSLLNFNVASFVDPDTRATAYRYFLDLEGVSPLGIGEYSVADHLYVLTFDPPSSVLYNQTYEVVSFRPKRVSKTWKFQDINIYRLERN